MGYYTSYKFSMEGEGTPTIREVAEVIGRGNPCVGHERFGHVIDGTEETPYFENILGYGDAAKWYEHENDMARVSLKWPDVVFRLDGDGEETGDLWTKYWSNGKVQTERAAEWVPPPFDPEKLKLK